MDHLQETLDEILVAIKDLVRCTEVNFAKGGKREEVAVPWVFKQPGGEFVVDRCPPPTAVKVLDKREKRTLACSRTGSPYPSYVCLVPISIRNNVGKGGTVISRFPPFNSVHLTRSLIATRISSSVSWRWSMLFLYPYI